MIFKNDLSSYGLVSKLFHWLVGVIIIGLITLGFVMNSIPPSSEKWQLYFIHEGIGITVLMLVILRFTWRIMNIQPLLPATLPEWQKLASRITHYLLYVFMFLMPISGVAMSCLGGYEVNVFNLFTIPAIKNGNIELAKFFDAVHVNSAIGFSVLIGLHIMAGLYHHFIRKDNVLMRMIR